LFVLGGCGVVVGLGVGGFLFGGFFLGGVVGGGPWEGVLERTPRNISEKGKNCWIHRVRGGNENAEINGTKGEDTKGDTLANLKEKRKQQPWGIHTGSREEKEFRPCLAILNRGE